LTRICAGKHFAVSLVAVAASNLQEENTMSIATAIAAAALGQIQSRLPKVIDARTHGVIDYCHAALFLGMAALYRKSNPRAAAVALAAGSFVLVESLLTDYPLGAAKVLSFRNHGRIDSALAASSMFMPALFGFYGTPESSIFKCTSLIEGTLVSLTDFNSELAR